ncbi:MAG: phosphate signaling complex protein PhoU [Treponema sp.]|nr:phosphate signaling complex protein PhoU [Treponema sp.]
MQIQSRKIFNDELDRLRQDILSMATKVEENLGKALAALRTRNVDLAAQVRESDQAVNALQYRIEDDAAILIATQQPVARDLREMVTIFKLTSSIERIGDHAVHLAKAAKKIVKKGSSPYRAQEHLEKMAETGQMMIRAAISAFLAKDSKAAREAAGMDNIIDSEHEQLTKNVLKYMKKNPDIAQSTGAAKAAYQLLHTSNQLERLGDHITNICEAVIYMAEGRHEELNE